MSEMGLKRKRESSPEPPVKRPSLGSTMPVLSGSSTPSTSIPLLDRFLADPKFDPATLKGDEADSWRQLIVEHMFTLTGPPARRGPKGENPASLLKSLPTFTPSVRNGSTAYIVVGPRVRGKFNVKRAEELGLYGPLRGRVAKGETVTFTVDDGTGAKLERTVKPEDCLGESETTKVSPPF